jgi:hypothetical protein
MANEAGRLKLNTRITRRQKVADQNDTVLALMLFKTAVELRVYL